MKHLQFLVKIDFLNFDYNLKFKGGDLNIRDKEVNFYNLIVTFI